jgi:lysophospholipase L1-like esterase
MNTRNVVCWTLLAGLALTLGSEAGEKKNPAVIPVPRDANWVKRHEGFVEIAKKGEAQVLFLGDSITDAWRGGSAKETWDKYFAKYKTANFGIGGDRTQHVLWRIKNGELEGINPKVVMLMIGTNNVSSNSAEEIAAGITEIVKTLREKKPEAKILLLAVFPRAPQPTDKGRLKIGEINKIISKLDDGKNIKYLDIGQKFLKEDGTLTKDIMPDYLHLSARGYQIWGDAVAPVIRELGGFKD